MSTQHKSQTNQKLEIKCQSSILAAQFDSKEVAKGGTANLFVCTQDVGDDSSIELELYNESGKKVGTAKGKIKNQQSKVLVSIDQPVGTKLRGLLKMPSHKLEASTSSILVVPGLNVASLEWLDSQGETLTEITDEDTIEVVAKVADMPDGTSCRVSLQFEEQNGQKSLVLYKQVRVSGAKLSLVWIPAFPRPEEKHTHDDDVKPTGGKYEHPKVVAKINYKDSEYTSRPIPYSSWMRFDFKGIKGKVTFRLPTGKEVTEPIAEDGSIKLKGCGVGAIEIVEIVPEDNPDEGELGNVATSENETEELIETGPISVTNEERTYKTFKMEQGTVDVSLFTIENDPYTGNPTVDIRMVFRPSNPGNWHEIRWKQQVIQLDNYPLKEGATLPYLDPFPNTRGGYFDPPGSQIECEKMIVDEIDLYPNNKEIRTVTALRQAKLRILHDRPSRPPNGKEIVWRAISEPILIKSNGDKISAGKIKWGFNIHSTGKIDPWIQN